MPFQRTLIAQQPPLTGSDVDQVQAWLQIVYPQYVPETDGNGIRCYGYGTATRIKDFKKSQGMREDGVFNLLTYQVLEYVAIRSRDLNPGLPNLNIYNATGSIGFRKADGSAGATSPAGWWVRLFRDSIAGELLWQGQSASNGAVQPSFAEATNVNDVSAVLALCAGDQALLPLAGPVAIPWADPLAAPPIPVPAFAPITVTEFSVQGRFLYRNSPVGADQVVLFERSVSASGEFLESRVSAASITVTGTSYAISFVPSAAPPLQQVPDVVVKAYRNDAAGNPQLVGSTVVYNARPVETSVDINCPPNGVIKAPDLTGEPFEEWATRLTALTGLPDLVAFSAGLFEGSERNRIAAIRHLASNIVLDRAANPPPSDTDMLPQYDGENDRKIREASIVVERVLRAIHLEALARADLTSIPGYGVALPFDANKKLALILNGTVAAGAATPLPAKIFYALLPATSLLMMTRPVLNMLRLSSGEEQRRLIENAKLDGLISRPAAASTDARETDDALIALAELRLQLKTAPEWQVDVAAITAAAEREALATWLSAEVQTAETWTMQLSRYPGSKELEWRALTYGLGATLGGIAMMLADSLKRVNGSAFTDIRELSTVDDHALRAAILPFAGIGSTTWPALVRDDDPKVASGKFVEWIRSFVPYVRTAASQITDLAAACLEIEDVVTSLRALTTTVAPRPVRTRKDLRDCDRTALRATILPVAQNHDAYSRWPAMVRRGTPQESTDALLARLRPEDDKQALHLFLDLYPYFLFDISAADLDALVGPGGTPNTFLQDLCNDPDTAQPIAKACGKHLHTLRLLWQLTKRDQLLPGLRTQVVEWFVTAGKTTETDVRNADITAAAEPLKSALQRAREEAGAPPANNVSQPSPFIPVNGKDQLVDCECAEWSSPTGAAAYLVDLLKFVDKSAQAGEFGKRRPDIRGLAITPANSTALVPEIDLGIELLEDLAASRSISTHNTTTSDEAALRLSPEHSTPHDDAPCYDRLKQAKSPIPLPYDQQLDIVRSYLQSFGTTRRRAMLAARKDIAHHTAAWELREPENEPLAWERLGLSPEEAAIFALVTDPADSLDEYFGFPEPTSDADVIKQLSHLPGFLERTALDLGEARTLLETLPAWLPITTTPPPAEWGCDLPAVTVEGLDPDALHRLHRYLRLRRCLEPQFADRPALAAMFERLREVVNSLALYLPNGGGWKLNDTFLWELATLMKLSCTPPICWFWWKDGLEFARNSAEDQKAKLAGLIDLQHTPGEDLVDTTSAENWTTVQKLCAIDFTGQTTDANRDPIRRAARLVEIANKIKLNPQLSVPQLHYLFWEQGFVAGPPPADQCWRANPEAAFNALSEEFGGVDPAGLDDPHQAAPVADSKEALRKLLTAMGFDNIGSGATPTSVILDKLDPIVRAIEPNEPVRYQVSYTAPLDIKDRFPESGPFRYDHTKRELGLKRGASEDEIIAAFLLISKLTLVTGNAPANEAARAALRVKLAELCQKPIDDLLFLRPIYPNQRELRLTLIDGTDPRTKDNAATSADAKKLATTKWGYAYAALQTFYDTLVKHFENGPATLGAGSSAGVDRDVVETLLFKQLQPFGNPSFGDEVQLPNLVWRDLLLPRGSGLEAKFYEFKYDFSLSDKTLPSDNPDVGDLKGTRRDADLFYTEKGKYLGTGKNDGLPAGWKQNTPWPLLLPSDHVFDENKGNPKPWRGRWKGRLFLPKAWTGKRIWLAFNLEPLNDNGFRVSVRPANSAHWQVIDDWRKDPPHKLVTEPLATNEVGFYDIDVQFYDVSKAIDPYDAKFALCAAVTPAGTVAAPAKDKFDPIPGALFYFTNGGVVVGKSEFDKGYQRAWKAVYYAHALRLIAPEIDYFSDDRTRFQGIYPTYPANAILLGTQPLDLNDLYELPVDDRKRAFLNQWEHLRDYTSLRDLPGTTRPARFVQFKAVFDLSAQAGDADPAVAAQPISIALFDNAAQTDLVKECLSYWDGYSLPNAVLKNEVWLRRVQPFVHLLQHASVWMEAGSRFKGDLVRLVAADPLVPAAGNGLKALFLQGHPSGDSRHLELVNGLRLRGRAALLAFLSVRGARWADGQSHTGGSVNEWSRMLLLDLECSPENRLSRIQSAIVSCQRFVHEKQMEDPAGADAWLEEWSGIATYAVWSATIDQLLYPENYVDKRQAFAKSAAFRLLESRLRRDQLSLLRPADDDPNPRSFDWLEEVERESGARLKQSLEGSASARDPHAGWIAPLDAVFSDGWQPGPMDMKATVLLQGADDLSDFRFLLWPVTRPNQYFEAPGQSESYKPPGENGEIMLSLKPERAVRVGWSYQVCKPGKHVADEWSEPFWTDEIKTIPDGMADVKLTAFQMGDAFRVALDGTTGFDITVRDSLPRLPRSRRSPARPAPANHSSLFGYGGLLHLPVEYAGPVNPLPGYDIVSTVMDSIPVFGLSADERSHHGSFLVAAQLERRGRFAEASEWLTRAKSLTSTFHWPDITDPKEKAGIIRHLQLLLAWAENGLARNTEESVRQAEGYYREAARLLGVRPRKSQCRAIENAGTIEAPSIESPNLNRAVLGLWDTLEAGLANVHFRRHEWSQNRPSLRSSAHAFALPHEAGAIAPQDWTGFRAHYRYAYLQQKALEFVNQLTAFSGALLAAFEKGDAEHLAALRAAQETQIGYAMLDVKQHQWAEAETQWRILKQNRFNTEFRKRYYEELISGGLNGGEQSHLNLLSAAEDLSLAAQGFELAAQGVALIPNLTTGGAGISSPVVIAKVTGGEMISSMMNFAARALHTIVGKQQSEAIRAVTGGGYDRRRREWEFQRDSAAMEVRSLERQIDAAGQQLEIAKREVNIQHQQLANSRRNAEFLRTKFTAADLYDWMQQELLILHHQMYTLAFGLAKQAELAYRFERHYTPRRFVHDDQLWSSYRFGLLAGEQLALALRAMDKTFMDENVREYELTKVFSARLHASEALVTLRLTGQCEIEIPEWHFDLDHPGHYRRRIKNVAVTIPCATGPYQSINATVTLLRDSVRLSPSLLPNYEEDQTLDGDDRFIRRYASHQSIVTTSGQNDTGLFETNLRDERYLPFEGAGVISRWRIEIDPAANQFEPDSLTDIVLQLRYTAIDGGVELRRSAQAAAYANLPSLARPARKYLDLRQDYPSEWLNAQVDQTHKIGLYLSRDMFPWGRSLAKLEVPEVEILIRPEAGQPTPEYLTISVNGQKSQLLLTDCGFGDAYHIRVELQPHLEIGPQNSASLELRIVAPVGQNVPQIETAVVSAGYFYSLPKQLAKPCE
jgi:hypothetical protein